MKKNFYACLFCLTFLFNQVSNATSNKFRIMWRSDPSTTMVIAWNQVSGNNPTVYYGTGDNGLLYNKYPFSKKSDRVVSYNGMNNHFARLTGLKPNTAYYFVIRDSQGVSKRFWFKTAPNDPNTKLSIIAGGDSRDGRAQRQNANKLVSKLRPHVVLFGGDMTRSNYDTEWQEWFDDWQLTIGTDGRMIPLVVARGNHETSDEIIVNHFDVPHANVYYALNLGGSLLRVYTLNSESSVAGDQTTWLSSDLAANAGVTWKMAQYHRPMRPHTSSKSDATVLYQYWSSLFYQHKVKLVIECDAHTVKSTWPLVPSTATGSDAGFIRNDAAGTVYLGEGCWGAPLRTNDDDKQWTRNSGMFNQFHWIFVSKDKIEARFIKTDNADQVGIVSDSNPFLPPANLSIWSPSNGSVVTIPAQTSGTSTVTVSSRIASGTDDAEERKDGPVYVGSSDIELVYDNSTTGNQTVGLRFTGLNIPKGASITEALVQFTADEISTEATNLVIKGENADNSTTFNSGAFNISSRNKTSASVAWSPIAWGVTGVAGPDQQTPNLKNIVQEIVNRSGWNPGNAISLIITGSGKRGAAAFEKSSALAAVIKVTYNKTSTTSPSVTTTYSIAQGADDVEQGTNGSVSMASTDLELVYDNSVTGNQVVGLRFQGVNIPKGAIISNAYLQFSADEIATAPAALTIRGEEVLSSSPFTTSTNNVSNRIVTSASVAWSPPAWDVLNEASVDQRSPDLKAIVQEIVNQSGWTAGNAMSFFISGSGKRTAKAYEGSSALASKLVVTYSNGATSATSELALEALPERVAEQTLKVSPNPASEVISIQLDEQSQGNVITYSFVSQNGTMALSGVSKLDNSRQVEIDVSSLAAGLYVLKVVSSEKTSSAKIIKK